MDLSKAIIVIVLFLALAGLVLWWPAGDDLPDYDDGQTVAWAEAVRVLEAGQAEMVVQAHNQTVSIRLKDGTTIKTTEPQIDAIFQVLQDCGGLCKDLVVATE